MTDLRPVIYIDVLFFVNFIINYILLYTTAKTGRLGYRHYRLILAALVGAVYAVCVFFPRLSFIYSMTAKAASSLALVAIAYNIRGVRLYLKALGIFYLITLCFGGGTFALFYFTDMGSMMGAVVKNGIVYLNLPWQLLFVSVFVSYIIIRSVWRALQNRMAKDNMYIGLSISIGGETSELTALVDTGNELYDPLTRAPVIVAEYGTLKKILPAEIKEIFENGYEGDLERLSETMSSSNVASRLRLIPFCSLGRENGMLIGIRPDSLTIVENERDKQIGNVIVALYSKNLSKDRSFHALLHPGILG